MGELAVVHAGVAAPLDAVVGRQLPGPLRLQENDRLGERVLVVERGGGAGDVAGEDERHENQRDGTDAAARRGVLLLHGAGVRVEVEAVAWVCRMGGGRGKGGKLNGGGVRLRLGGCEVVGPEWLRFQAGQAEVSSGVVNFSCFFMRGKTQQKKLKTLEY